MFSRFKKYLSKKNLFIFFILKKILLIYLMGSLVFPIAKVNAQAVPVANFVINKTISGVIKKTIIKRGFAANDPRYYKTLEAISSSSTTLNVASGAVGVVLAVAGAPVWLTILAGLGVFAVGSYLTAGEAGQAQLELTPTNIQYRPIIKSIPQPYSGNYPQVYKDPELLWHPRSFYEAYAENRAKMYRGPNCFSLQLCAGLPAMPVTYEPPIRHVVSNFANGVHGIGEFIVAFDSLAEFSNGVVFRPDSPDGTAAWKSSNGKDSRSYEIYDLFYNPPTISIQNVSKWDWTIMPYFDVAPNGQVRIVGEYSTSKTCLAVASEPCNTANYPTLQFHPFSGTRYSYISSDTFFVNDTKDSRTQNQIIVTSNSYPSTHPDADDLKAKLSAVQKAQVLSPETIASIVNAAWKHAAQQPGYDGLPYSINQPVTTTEVNEYLSNNTSPTIDDLLTVANEPGVQTVPIIEPTGDGNNNGSTVSNNVNVVNTPSVKIEGKVQIDFGEGTNQSEPDLSNMPVLRDIFDPIITWAANKTVQKLPPHASECPVPTVDFFGEQVTLSAHCNLVTENKDTIAGVLMFFYHLTAFIIVFSA